jgi:polygalacturonase
MRASALFLVAAPLMACSEAGNNESATDGGASSADVGRPPSEAGSVPDASSVDDGNTAATDAWSPMPTPDAAAESGFAQGDGGCSVQTYPLPSSAVPSKQFHVTANAVAVPVSTVETPSTTAPAFFTHIAHLSTSCAVPVVIDAGEPITSYSVHPESFGLSGVVSGSTLTLSVSDSSFAPQPTYLVVRINALEELALLVDPPEVNVPPSSGAGVFNVQTKYGADATGSALSTTAIQSAIDDASAAGMSVVYVPRGVYKIQALALKSNVTLYLEGGAVLLASPDLADYAGPFAPAGGRLPDVIGGTNVDNVTIRGRGWIDANVVASGIVELGANRRRVISPTGGTNLTIEGVFAGNNASWTINPEGLTGITVTNVKVINPKWATTDGIDIGGSNAVVSKCFVHTGDDAYCSKSSKVGYALTNVTYRDSVASVNSAGVKAGMQAAGPHSHITFENIDVIHAGRGLAVENNTGAGANPITDIAFSDIRVESVTNGGTSNDRKPIELVIRAGSLAPIQRVTFDHVTIGNFGPQNSALTGLDATNQVTDVTFTNLVIAGTPIASGAVGQFTLTFASNVAFQ